MLRDVNPLNVHNLREVEHCPPHFTGFALPTHGFEITQVKQWIYENLDGRFYLDVARTEMQWNLKMFFEIPQEAGMAMLVIPDKVKNEWQ